MKRSLPQINYDYITQVSEEIEGRVPEELSQEFSRMESRFLTALSKLVEFVLNPQVRTQSRTVSATSWNSENKEPNKDRSENAYPHPEVGTSTYRSPQSTNSDPEDASYKTNSDNNKQLNQTC